MYFGNFDDGYDSVVDGSTWGLLYFEENFTKALIATAGNPTLFDDDRGRLNVYLDTTSESKSNCNFYQFGCLHNLFVCLCQSSIVILACESERQTHR